MSLREQLIVNGVARPNARVVKTRFGRAHVLPPCDALGLTRTTTPATLRLDATGRAAAVRHACVPWVEDFREFSRAYWERTAHIVCERKVNE